MAKKSSKKNEPQGTEPDKQAPIIMALAGVEINGLPLCILCMQFIMQDLAREFVAFCEDEWQAIDTAGALKAAEILTA